MLSFPSSFSACCYLRENTAAITGEYAHILATKSASPVLWLPFFCSDDHQAFLFCFNHRLSLHGLCVLQLPVLASPIVLT